MEGPKNRVFYLKKANFELVVIPDVRNMVVAHFAVEKDVMKNEKMT